MITLSAKHSFLISLSRFGFIAAFLLLLHINTQAQTTYTVGPAGNYTTIAAAYNACTSSTIDYIIELLPTYSSTAEAASTSITLATNTAKTITIRPQAGNTACLITTGITAPLFQISGGDNIIFDGRPGGSGTTGLMTLQNTSTAVGAGASFALSFINGATFNKVQYCTIKGSSPNTNINTAGVIGFGDSGNNSNTIDHCTIQATASAKPTVAINSYSGAGLYNSNITISNCNIVDFTTKGILITSAGNTGWNILNNSFYQSASFTPTSTIEMISIASASGFTVSGNYLGGQAPSCGGSPYVFGSYCFKGIYFSSSSGTNTISDNTIQNFAISGNNYSTIYGFVGIYLRGSATFTCGGAGQGNTIGSLSTANSITFSNSATGGSAGFSAIVDSAVTAGTIISYNNIGGIQTTTNLAGAVSDLIMISTGGATVDNNHIGSTAAPITHTSYANLTLINSTGSNFTATNNVIQGINMTNASGTNALYCIKNSGTGTYDCSDNTITNITSSNNGLVSVINYSALSGSGTFQTNIINTITLTNTGTTCGLNVFDISSVATATIDENTIGTTAANNISVAGNKLCNVIINSGNGPFIVTDNTVQNISLSSTGTTNGFIGIGVSAGYSAFTCTGNLIQSISCATANTIGYGSIYASVIATGLIVSGNTVSNVAFTNATAVATINNGIYLGGSGTYGGTSAGNIVTGLSNASTSAIAKLTGIELSNGSWVIENNVILLDNAAGSSNMSITGIDLAATGSTDYLYNNTVKIYGTQSGTLSSSACGGNSTSGTFTVKNNLFQNIRSGGTGSFYAENYPTGPTITTNYNYVESSTPSAICKKGATTYTFATWQSSVSPNSVNGTSTIDATGKVTSAPFAGASKGAGSPPPVTTDIQGVTRSTTAPWIGAYEGFEILTGVISPSSTCPGSIVSVPFTLNGNFNTPYSLVAQLSDASGSFTSPVTIGSSTTAAAISATIPGGTAAGTSYKIRVISTSPAVTGVASVTTITVNALPTISVTPDFTVCSTVLSNSLAAFVGGSATGVTWTTSGSGSFSNANIVNPTYTYSTAEKSAGQVLLTATTTGSVCTAASSTLKVTFAPTPVMTAVTPPAICSGSATNITLSSSPAATSYSWTRASVTGITPATSSGTANPIVETLTNSNASVTTVIYSVTPTLGTCSGNVMNITQNINPAPVPSVTISATATTICPGTNITFTPTPTNGGASPFYQWQKNGTAIGGASNSTYSTTTAANGDVFSVALTSNATCATPATVTSPGVTITVNPTLIPSVVISATATTICTGTNVTFTPTPTNGGTSPFYQWQKNGTAIGGASNSTYSTTAAATGDVFSVVLTSNAPCVSPTTATSPGVTMTVNPTVIPSVAISATATTICAGTAVTFTATPSNGGTTPAYQWSKNAATIAGATNSTYVTSTVSNGDVFSVVLTSNAACASPTTATSAAINMTVNPTVTPSVSITATATTICPGASVSFSASSVNGGTSPFYQWQKNGTAIGGASTSTYVTSTISNSDVFTATVTSNATCASPITVTSTGITMTVNPTLIPSVTIAASATTVCPGTNITFTPTPTNGGASPFYQWQKNGTAIGGASNSTYSTTAAVDGDIFSVVLTSNAACASPITATSPGVTITVTPTVIPAIAISATATTICTGTAVTFTATPTNGGATPAYQWKKNAVAISGATNSTYVTSSVANGDVFRVALTSNAACASPTTATSAAITMTVNPILVPSVTIAASATTICPGTNITFTPTPTNGGTSPFYQWQKNGTAIAGASNSTYSTTTAADGDVFSVVLTSNATCATPITATSTGVTITVNPVLVPSVVINASATTICTGTNVTFTPTPTNGGASPFYQWQKNGTAIGGASNSTYSTTTAVTGDVFSVVLTSNATCASPTTATSPGVTMTVNSTLVPAVAITATATTICTGTAVTYTATPTNGGTTPAYQWKKNAVVITGATNSTYVTSTISNGDIFTVVLTSNAGCASPTTATSTGITMTVNPVLVPSVTITASATTICPGTNITFTPTPINGGASPFYQWQKNGTAIAGASNSTYSTTTAANSDVFSVVLTSNATCATPITATSTGVTITVNPALVPSVVINASATTICTGTNVTFTPTPTNGGASPFYQWQKNGTAISGASNSTYSTTAAVTGDVFSVVLTSNAICASPTTATSPGVTMTVNSTLVPAVAVTATATTICTGTAVTYTATPTNGGVTPAYQWKKNATTIAGATNSTYVTSTISNGDIITVVLTSNAGCASPTTVTSTGITMTVNPILVPSVTIAASTTTICAGSNITFTPTPINGGTLPSYQWQKNGTVISGASSSTYSTTTAINGDVFSVVLTSNATCVSPTTATSTGVTITVNTAPTANAGTDISACSTGGAINLSGTITNASSSQWASTGTGTFSNATSLTSTYTPSVLDKTNGQAKIVLRAISSPCPIGTDTLTIIFTPAPTINAGPDKSYCANIGSILLSGSGSIGTWSGGAGTYTPNATTANATYTPAITEITAGSVTLTYTSFAGLCPVVSDQVTFTFKPLPTATPVSAISICSGTSTNISLASTPSGSSFTWTVSPVSGTVTGAAASTASGTVINQTLSVASGSGTINYIATPTLNGCVGNDITIPVTVSVPVISPASIGPATLGTNFTQTFSVTNMTSPVWTSTGSIPGITIANGTLSGTPTAANTYPLSITATEGLCTATQSYSLVVGVNSTTWNGTAWSNNPPDASTNAIINGNYTTTGTETFIANTITVNSGSIFTITGTSSVTTTSLTNNGTINQQCTSTLAAKPTGNPIVIVQPVLSPTTLDNGKITTPYIQSTPFSLSFGTSFTFNAAGLPDGLQLTTNAGVTQLTGTPNIAGIYTIAVTATNGGACFVNTSLDLKILNLANPKLKFTQPTLVKTYGDVPFTITATSLSGAPISYSISPSTNGCISLVNGLVTITCVPSSDVWLVASQDFTSQYQTAKDSMKIIVNKATPVVSLLTLPGILINKTALFDYQLPSDYTGTASYEQTDGTQVASIDAGGNITGLSAGTFDIDLILTSTNNFFSLDTTFSFSVYDNFQRPTAVADTVVLTRNDGTIADDSINLLKNDYGVTGHLRVNLTDIDIINAGNQDIFYNPSVGTFQLNQSTGVLTIHPAQGLTGTARIGYTITDSNGVTSDVAYVTIEIHNTQDVPGLKVNEVMTPNNDGKNDVLFVGYTDISKKNEITIMDAASNVIYKTSDYQNDWAGTNNKGEAVEAGVYFYVFSEEEGLSREIKGIIRVLR